MFEGKKEIIFDQAIKLIAIDGFEAVNLRKLATMCGIRAASIYNHFSSKREILDCIYNYYTEHFLDNKKSEEDIKKAIETGTKNDIIEAFTFTFESEDQKKYQRLVLITKIIYARIYIDKKAAEIFDKLMNKDRESEINLLLQYGIKINRFNPFDTKTFASLMCSSVHMMGIKAFTEVNYIIKQLDEEKDIKLLLADLLPLKE